MTSVDVTPHETSALPRPRNLRKFTRIPVQCELDSFVRAAGPNLKKVVRFKLETDATEHEIVALDWNDINVSQRLARLKRANGKMRTVSLSPMLIEMLAKSSRIRMGRVFRSDNGRPYNIGGKYGGRFKIAFEGASARSGVRITFSMLHQIYCARRREQPDV